ncbi:hypothetical protein Aph01nite_75960 [Acrocarpospora phusangensis]|uniref:DUF4034 domain-containing protein n=1 Tax=Acrocarpospora phusangensis TaxID=1070424 RepID=A0A919QK56_9ACTN|nr:hypothetical protein [Acrocarpospora phusangensis]GIH29286.1 hypothetical protein Aph01nite_75960 [Acrocarpospora phusangensis]
MGILFGRKKAPKIDVCAGDPEARRLRQLLAARDWRSARDLLTAHTDPDVRTFYYRVCASVDGVQDWIGEWVAAEPDSTVPLLVKGVHGVSWAWEARGGRYASETSAGQFRGFAERLKMAEDCLDEVVERDPDEVVAWSSLVTSARGRGVGHEEIWRRFDNVLRIHPFHEEAYNQMLQALCAKWSGSDEEMFTFAREAAAQAPAGSPIGTLVATAHLEYCLNHRDDPGNYLARPGIVAELHTAADQSVRHPSYRRRPGWPVAPNVFAMVFCMAEEYAAAADLFQMFGDIATEWPWTMFDDPARTFRGFRAEALQKAGR